MDKEAKNYAEPGDCRSQSSEERISRALYPDIWTVRDEELEAANLKHDIRPNMSGSH